MASEDKQGKLTIEVEIMDKLATLVTVSFGFVAALTGNETLKMIFRQILGSDLPMLFMVIYAVIITIIAVIITIIAVIATMVNARGKAKVLPTVK